jgi:hypothetical protein
MVGYVVQVISAHEFVYREAPVGFVPNPVVEELLTKGRSATQRVFQHNAKIGLAAQIKEGIQRLK